MALPIVETPRYECTLASQDIKVQYRPFFSKRRKDTISGYGIKRQQRNNKRNKTSYQRTCTYDKVDVDKLPMFDIEYLLLQKKSKSVGEISNLKLFVQMINKRSQM